MKTILHIGLHKTGTTFLQHHLYSQFPRNLCLYNPNELLSPIRHALILQDMGDLTSKDIISLKIKVKSFLHDVKTPYLLLSDELLSQNMYSLNYARRSKLLSELFPDAGIILFLRYQVDWLKSVYKQALQQGDVLPIKDFFKLDFNDAFQDIFTKNYRGHRITMNPLKTDFPGMLESFKSCFSHENVHILFYENLRLKRDETIHGLCKIIGIEAPDLVSVKPVNRSYSALACILTLRLYRVLDVMHMRCVLPNSIEFYQYMKRVIRSSSFVEDSKGVKIREDFLDWDFVKGNFALAKIIEIFFKKLSRRVRLYNPWRFLMQEILDKMVYIDWDIFEKANIKEKLDEHFDQQNQRLSVILSPQSLPLEYFKKM